MKRVYAFGFFVSAASLSFLCHAAPVKLPAGMSVPLELQHHINSGYVPVGSPIYFRVAKDVRIDGWSILRFCRDGQTTLRFRGTNGTGETVDGSIQMHVKIKNKGLTAGPLRGSNPPCRYAV
jgi:hypothetical protein